MSFTDQKPWLVTEADTRGRWNGLPDGRGFRCYLCGHRFEAGDRARFVYANTTPGARHNFFTCSACDGPDVLARWVAHCRDLKTRFWWAINEG